VSNARESSNASDQAVAEIPSCALDEAGRHEQLARYAILASSVMGIERQPRTMLVTFDRDLDHQTLQQALSVERDCCPFFSFDFDERKRSLRATVTDADHAPALDALAAAFEATRRLTCKG
jgi:hypothetical protein